MCYVALLVKSKMATKQSSFRQPKYQNGLLSYFNASVSVNNWQMENRNVMKIDTSANKFSNEKRKASECDQSESG